MKSRILMRGKKEMTADYSLFEKYNKNKKYWKMKILENENVFSFFLKVSNDFCFLVSTSKLFQILGPAELNARQHGKRRRSWFVAPPEEMYRPIGDLEQTLFRITIRRGMTALTPGAVPTSEDQRSNLETDTLCYGKPMQLSQKWRSP